MPASFQAHGVWTALVTPFDKNGAVDFNAFKRLIEFQTAEGVTGLVPAGTTGESPTLSWEEHNQVIAQTVLFAQGKAGVLAGTGSNSTDEAIDATRHAARAGASAALLVDCYYNCPSSLELRTEYYEYIAQQVPEIPLVPYIIPGRSGTALSAEDLAILHRASPERFPAVKEATGDLQRMRRERDLCGAKLAIFSGDDDLTFEMMQDSRIGAAGAISVMSNLAPRAISSMVSALAKGSQTSAASLSAQLEPLFKLVGCKASSTRQLPDGKSATVEDRFRNPVPVKTMMAALGMPVGPCRKPLGKMTRGALEQCRAALRLIHRGNPQILRPIEEAFGVKIEQRLDDDTVWAELDAH